MLAISLQVNQLIIKKYVQVDFLHQVHVLREIIYVHSIASEAASTHLTSVGCNCNQLALKAYANDKL